MVITTAFICTITSLVYQVANFTIRNTVSITTRKYILYLKLYDGAGTILHEYKSFLKNAGDNRKNDLKQNDMFYVKLDDDYGLIKTELILSIIDDVTNIVDCKLYNTYNSNLLCIKHIKKN